MQTYLSEQLVHDRISELRRCTTSRPARSRERVRWALVTIGMRMVGDGHRVPAHVVG